MMKYIDIHGHVNFPEYDADRQEVIDRARKALVHMITVGTDVETSKSAVSLAQDNDDMWATVGIHPTEKSVLDASWIALARENKVVAIGECGLDYFRSKEEDWKSQEELFISHIELANKVNKPLMLHVRNGERGQNAYAKAFDILKANAKVPANFHFFAGTVNDMEAIFDIGGTVSFTAVITFASSYDELIKYAPLTKIMTETDAPFVAPKAQRGKRNEPMNVIEVVRRIGEIKGLKEDEVASAVLDNAKRVFSL